MDDFGELATFHRLAPELLRELVTFHLLEELPPNHVERMPSARIHSPSNSQAENHHAHAFGHHSLIVRWSHKTKATRSVPYLQCRLVRRLEGVGPDRFRVRCAGS